MTRAHSVAVGLPTSRWPRRKMASLTVWTLRRAALLSPALLFVVACAPSIDSAARADVDRRVGSLKNSERTFAAPEGPAPMPLAAGQWATYKFTDDKGQPSFLTMKLVGQDGRAFWYETLQESYYGRSAARMLIDFGDRKTIKSVTIKAAKIRDASGQVTDYPEPMIGMMNSVLRGQLGPIVQNWTDLPQENATSAAGRFAGCFKGRSEVSFAGYKVASVVWGHPSVPLAGMVRSRGDNKTSAELVAFGTSGATTSF
jgi:hypothetical protein